jgi:hypothetical protein
MNSLPCAGNFFKEMKHMKDKVRITSMTVATILLILFSVSGCRYFTDAETSKVTKPPVTSAESIKTAESTEESENTIDNETQASSASNAPMTAISPEDFTSIASKLGYVVSDVNYDGSGLDELLSGSDREYFCNVRYSLFSSEESAKAGIRDWYDRQVKGEEGGGFVGEISLDEKEGYDIVIAKSTDENMPSYAVYIRINDVILDAFCFSFQDADIQIVNNFFLGFGYSVEG